MMILLRFWRPLVGLLVLLAVIGFIFAQGHKRGLAQGREELAAYRLEIGAKLLEAQAKADQAASDFEVWKRNQRPKVITVVKEVDRALAEARDWSEQPIDPRVRDALAAAAAALNDPGESDGTVPAGPPAEPANERGPRSSLPGSLDLGGGMSGQASAVE